MVAAPAVTTGEATPNAPAWLAPACALVVAALAVAVLAGWQFHVPLLRSGAVEQPVMPPLTAAALLVCAAALWLVAAPEAGANRRGVGHVLAGLVAALGLATLVEYAFSVDLGFDLLLYPTAVLETSSDPAGRPSPLTALALTLLGPALLLLDAGRRRARVAQGLALGAGAIGALVAIGYLYRIGDLRGPVGLPPMAMHTALAVLVLSLGLLLARPRVGLMSTLTAPDVGGLTARRLLPIVLLLPVLLGALVAELLRGGGLSAAQGLFLVGVLLAISFAIVVWRSALDLREIDRERRQAALALVQSEERFRSLAENAADAMITINARGAVVFANPAAERLFGYSADELAEMRFTDLMPERHREAHRQGVERYETTGRRRIPWGGVEFSGLHRDGREIPLEITLGEYVRDGRHYFTGIMRDIGERRRTEAAQRLLLEAGRVLSASLDHEATLRGVTRLAVAELADWCAVYGREGDEVHAIELAAHDMVRDVRLRELENAHPPGPDHPIMRVLEGGEPLLEQLDDDAIVALADGDEDRATALREIGYRSLVAVPLVARGRTIGALALGAGAGARPLDSADVATARELAVRIAFAVDNARLYEAARDARAQAESRAFELERVTESRARLMRGFSHDLKNPLSAADGHAQLLESGTLGEMREKQTRSVGYIRRAIRGALGLIDDLVELARTESGQLELDVRQIDTTALALEVAEEYRPQAEAKGLELGTRADGAHVALGDAPRVRQIVGNLLGNAIKYTEEGRVSVLVRGSDGSDGPRPGSWVCIEVEDTGPGITPQQQEHLFDEFTRFSSAVPGSGLGLSISRNLAEALGGTVTVASEPGEGTRFCLWLPAAGGERPSEQAEPVRSSKRNRTATA